MTLKLMNVTKRYKQFTAVDGLDFTIAKGEIFGLIGQNGAGKTTTFRMILDLQEVTTGEITWDGQLVSMLNRDVLGYLPEERGIFPQMKVEEQLLFFGKLRGMQQPHLQREIDFWLTRFQLEERRHDKAETLSKGNQQKVQLIASFLHRPQFLILDEPFSGLDPVNMELLKKAIIYLKQDGMTILFSSHQMDHVEELCDHLCLLKRGRMLFSGSLLDLKKQYGKTSLTVRTTRTIEELKELAGVVTVIQARAEYVLQLVDEASARGVFDVLMQDGYIEKFSLDYLSLHEIFKQQVGERDV